jgi:hypothetical protein
MFLNKNDKKSGMICQAVFSENLAFANLLLAASHKQCALRNYSEMT